MTPSVVDETEDDVFNFATEAAEMGSDGPARTDKVPFVVL
jgi:hypothetical protein